MTDFVQMATQKAIYSVLTGDATLMTMVEGVYDFVPQDAAYPYITLGDAMAEDVSTLSQAAYQLRLQIHIYSRAKGRKEIYDIMQRVHGLLHNATPSVTGYDVVGLRFQRSDAALAAGGDGYHGRMVFSVLVETE